MNSIDNMINEYTNGTGNSGTNTPTDVPIENIKSDWATIEKIAKRDCERQYNYKRNRRK